MFVAVTLLSVHVIFADFAGSLAGQTEARHDRLALRVVSLAASPPKVPAR
jgi:hypothetical protein